MHITFRTAMNLVHHVLYVIWQ